MYMYTYTCDFTVYRELFIKVNNNNEMDLSYKHLPISISITLLKFI